MTVLKRTFKSSALILMTGLLFACQDDTSADTQTKEVIIENSTKIVEQAKPAVATPEKAISQAVTAKPEKIIQEVAPRTPRPPADFSTLDSKTYHSVPAPFAVSTGDQIEVAELFWFGCGHCFALEPHIKTWLKDKPANAKFKKIPAVFSKRWEFHAKAYYTMEALNVPEQAYDQFFRRLHVQKVGINTIDSLTKFLEPFGKDKATVESTFNSFAVDSKLRNAIKITKASGARGVPAIVVDGKYLTSQSDAGGTQQMFDVVDKLVSKAATER